jgi:hypothetical protein
VPRFADEVSDSSEQSRDSSNDGTESVLDSEGDSTQARGRATRIEVDLRGPPTVGPTVAPPESASPSEDLVAAIADGPADEEVKGKEDESLDHTRLAKICAMAFAALVILAIVFQSFPRLDSIEPTAAVMLDVAPSDLSRLLTDQELLGHRSDQLATPTQVAYTFTPRASKWAIETDAITADVDLVFDVSADSYRGLRRTGGRWEIFEKAPTSTKVLASVPATAGNPNVATLSRTSWSIKFNCSGAAMEMVIPARKDGEEAGLVSRAGPPEFAYFNLYVADKGA